MVNRGRYSLFADSSTDYSARAIDLVQRSAPVDMLGLLTLDWNRLYQWQQQPASFGDAEIQKLMGTGTRVFHPAVDPNHPDPHGTTRRWIAGWNRLLQAHPERLVRIDGAADLERVREGNRLGLLIGFQNSDHFRDAADVALFHGLGQRVSQLTYNARNRIGSGCDHDGGLTPYGAGIVAAMNEVGMAVDISHCSDRTSLDAVAASRKPVLATHSNCRALVPHRRCKPDSVIRAVAARGGVLGITVIPAFAGKRQPVTLEDVLDHFDYAARLVGPEHVGLGSDCDTDAIDPKTGRIRPRYVVHGLRHARRTFDIAEGLLRRGYAEKDIELILGGSFRRALAEIWGPAPPLAPTTPDPARAAG